MPGLFEVGRGNTRGALRNTFDTERPTVFYVNWYGRGEMAIVDQDVLQGYSIQD